MDDKHSAGGKRLARLAQHNARLAGQLSDANKRISRLKFERSLLLDKLYDMEKRLAIDAVPPDEATGWSSESEGEYRECEWWKSVDVAAVLARNPIGATPPVKKAPAKKRRKPVPVHDLSTDEDLVDGGGIMTEEDESVTSSSCPNVQTSGMLFEFDGGGGGGAPSTAGSSPPTKKRRSNKASATDAVLKTLHVEYDSANRPILPLNVGVVTIEELGEVVWDRAAYHNRRYILPVGFHSTRSYLSTVDVNGTTIYHSRILDGGAAPLFQVTADDAPGALFQAPTSTGAWSAVVRAANQLRQRDYSNSASGPDYYGLSNATVAMLIEELPGSERCGNYQRKRFERGAAHVKTIGGAGSSGGGATKQQSQQPHQPTALAEVESDQVSGAPSEADGSGGGGSGGSGNNNRQTRIDSLVNAAMSLE